MKSSLLLLTIVVLLVLGFISPIVIIGLMIYAVNTGDVTIGTAMYYALYPGVPMGLMFLLDVALRFAGKR